MEVVYRYGGVDLFACGVLLVAADTYIVMEQCRDQYGGVLPFELEIPNTLILRLEPARDPQPIAET